MNVPRVEPPHGNAIYDDATLASLARYESRGRLWLVLGLVLLVGCFALLRHENAQASALLAHGARAPGFVVRLRPDDNAWIVVRYAVGSTVRVARLNVHDAYDYYVGEDLTVIYDPRNPGHIRTEAERNRPIWSDSTLLIGFGLGAVLVIAGVDIARRARRWRRLLSEREWEPVRSRCIVRATRTSAARFELTPLAETASEPLVVKIVAFAPRARKLRRVHELWLARDPQLGAVLAVPETRELFSAASIRLRRRLPPADPGL